ncbi:ATP-grasp domain-containing protein [Streptomyces sp. NPDC058525]|uniref:ATP-grasp domain-containing protein n=1 Tax=Streptomyces sp. NPDC058525 TaxID=3346538 RepID=UPI00364DAE8A
MSYTNTSLPTVAVVYALGAGSPTAVTEAGRGLCEILWVYDSSDGSIREAVPLLRHTAAVLDVAGLLPQEAAAALVIRGVDAITTFSESRIRWTADVAVAAGWPYHSLNAARALTDKAVQRTAFTQAGVSPLRHQLITPSQDPTEAASEVRFPAVLKPRSGAGSRNTLPVTDLHSLHSALSAVPDDEEMVLEEQLRGDSSVAGSQWGDYVSVETLTGPEGHEVLAVCGKLPLVTPYRETGSVFPSTLSSGPLRDAEKLAMRALDALGVGYGISHTEVKLTLEGPRLIEVNGRVGGGTAPVIRAVGGPDLLQAALCAALGMPYAWDRNAPQKVAYEYLSPAPTQVAVVRSISGIREIRKLPGVTQFSPSVRPGTLLDWRTGTESYLGWTHGVAANHDEVLTSIGRIDALLKVELEERDKAVQLAADCPAT